MKRYWIALFLFAGLILIGITASFFIQLPLHERPFSPVLYSAEGELCAALVAEDEQWRFPRSQDLPDFLQKAILLYEDEYFYYHPGVNPISLWKAFWANLQAGRIVRGGSTLSMQVVRMARQSQERTYYQKMLETLGAFRLDLFNSKERILSHWCRLASFGGNVEGVETAAWRYFGRPLNQLSRAELATLAVLPNAPALIHPGKNRTSLRDKRNALLEKMCRHGFIRQQELSLLKDEPLPEQPFDLPQVALHLLTQLKKEYPNEYLFETTINASVQKHSAKSLQHALKRLESKGIRSAAALIIDVELNELVAYCGNTRDASGRMRYVDLIRAPRSYGSLLKPFLYAFALDHGTLLPKELISDVPTNIRGFEPDNFDEQFRGAVHLDEMIIQSLNVPAVRALHYIGYRPFFDFLKTLQPNHLNKDADHYGLSIILGGAESDLWSLSRMYKGLARNYLGYPYAFSPTRVLTAQQNKASRAKLSEFSVYHTVHAMADLEKPREEQGWERLRPTEDVAWKTGTSYGHRDAWSIGFNSKYLVAVWVGNEDGEGRSGLTGVKVAAPIFFHLLDQFGQEGQGLLRKKNFPYTVQTCAESGRRAGPLCNHKTPISVHQFSHQWRTCHFHKQGRVEKEAFLPWSCLEPEEAADTFFVLPAVEESYFRRVNGDYFVLPPVKNACRDEQGGEAFSFVYPFDEARVFLPIESNGERKRLVSKAAVQGQKKRLFWYLNDRYLGTTSELHEMPCLPSPGRHTLTVIHESGRRLSTEFQVYWD